MSSRWPVVSLGEILTQYAVYIDAPEPRVYPKLSVRLYGKGVVLDAPMDGAELKMRRHQIARAGQVILSEIWGKKGAIGLVPDEGEGALCTSHFFLFDPRDDRIDRGWLRAIVAANYLESQLSEKAFGTTGYAAVRPRDLLDCTIPLPPMEEQRRIVVRIEGLAAKIEEARGLRQHSDTETGVLFAAASRQCLSDRNWGWLSVENACEALVDYRGRTPPLSAQGIPHITSANIRNGTIDWDTPKFVTEETYSHYMTRGIPRSGDVIFTMEAPLGEAAALTDDRKFSLAQRTLLLRGKPSLVTGEFLARALATPVVRDAIYAQATGTTVKGIAAKRLRKVLLPIPPLSEQRRIVAYLDGLQAKVDQLKALQARSAAELAALLPAMLERAFGGEL